MCQAATRVLQHFAENGGSAEFKSLVAASSVTGPLAARSWGLARASRGPGVSSSAA
jgi:hypothetical protein